MLVLLLHTILQAIMITGFVFMMMMIIEYLNIMTCGVWQKGLRGSRLRQYVLASFLGATPGCLGAFTVVSLYSHREVSFGALVAAMIATSGDESFIMISMIPSRAPVIFIVLFAIALIAGFVTDIFFDAKTSDQAACPNTFDIHEEEVCACFPWGKLRTQWREEYEYRGVLTLGLFLFLAAVVTGWIGPDSWNWLRSTLVLLTLVALFIVSTVSGHFLKEHLWNHAVKDHVPRVFLWTFGTLMLLHILVDHLHLELWIQNNQFIVLLLACCVGLIPESGPHLLFLTLYVENTIPFSTFLASSIVQDGHGTLPLLAESRGDFLKVKGINFLVGLLVGGIGYICGW